MAERRRESAVGGTRKERVDEWNSRRRRERGGKKGRLCFAAQAEAAKDGVKAEEEGKWRKKRKGR